MEKNKIGRLSEANWMNEITEKVLEAFPDQEVYTCAAGISPSGIVHFGNFRDVMTAYVIKKQLEKRGKKTRFIFSWDEYDRFRKVPVNVPAEYDKYIGLPLTKVPDYKGLSESYARTLEMEFEESMKKLGIDLDYLYQSKEYTSGRYDNEMIFALKNRKEIAKILLSRMSDKGIEEKKINPEEYINNFYPVSIYSSFTGKDSTKIISYDGDKMIKYLCLETKKEEIIDITKNHQMKLTWKVDWPMRWGVEGVVFEPGGQDHASPNGSYDSSSEIMRKVFNKIPPVFAGYEFIGIRGLEGKMSGSKGNAVTPGQLLKIYEPDLLKWLYTRKSPQQKFELAFDSEVFRQYDEFDRAIKEYVSASPEDKKKFNSLSLIENIGSNKFLNPIPFRQAVAYGQILNWDLDKIMFLIKKSNLNYDRNSVESRLKKAYAWLNEYNSEEMIVLNSKSNVDYFKDLNGTPLNQINDLKSELSKIDFDKASIEEFEKILYAIPRKYIKDESELKIAQRNFFKDVYMLFINKETGPRLPTFIWAIGKDKSLNLLSN